VKIVIFTQSPISKAPRVVKEANCLVRNGLEVTVFSLWYETKIIQKDFELLDSRITYQPGIDISIQNVKSAFCRMKRRVFRELVCFFGIQSKHALGYGYNQYLKNLKTEKADLYIGHEEMSLALAKDLIEEGFKVGFDFEDYHSHDLLPKDRKYRPIILLKDLESFILKSAVYTMTTSDSLAKELAKTYNTPLPKTIYNSFKRQDKTIGIKQNTKPSLVWISQIIGPGRGLELLIESVSKSKLRFKLTLIGKKDENYCRVLISNIPSNLKIEFSNYIPVQDIAKYLSQFDLGIAFEEFEPLNRDLTISNKIFHYLNAGIGVLATNTKGQIELKDKTGAAIEIVSTNSREIARKLEEIFLNLSHLDTMKKTSRIMGRNEFCFEREEMKIKDLVEGVFK
jgi:hypothetical protein